MGAATLFTAAQWKELERQAMIYKYMVASVPVPYQLLLPIIHNHSPSPLVRCSTKQDLEPWRCKRTDGKKWRCSRDVASPNHKYCDRHMHRGRPRSRKHVELPHSPPTSISLLPNSNSNKKTRLQKPCQPSTPCKVVGSSSILPQPPFFLHHHHMHSNNRGLDWSMEVGPQQQIMQTSHSIFNNDFIGQESLTNIGRDFIDKTNVVKDSWVDLSTGMPMGLGNNIENELGIGLGSVSCGGPLAEVLGPSLVANPTEDSPPATTVSSTSGVLHRTMLSLSDADASVCNSPTTLASTPTPTPPDIGFQWFT